MPANESALAALEDGAGVAAPGARSTHPVAAHRVGKDLPPSGATPLLWTRSAKLRDSAMRSSGVPARTAAPANSNMNEPCLPHRQTGRGTLAHQGGRVSRGPQVAASGHAPSRPAVPSASRARPEGPAVLCSGAGTAHDKGVAPPARVVLAMPHQPPEASLTRRNGGHHAVSTPKALAKKDPGASSLTPSRQRPPTMRMTPGQWQRLRRPLRRPTNQRPKLSPRAKPRQLRQRRQRTRRLSRPLASRRALSALGRSPVSNFC